MSGEGHNAAEGASKNSADGGRCSANVREAKTLLRAAYLLSRGLLAPLAAEAENAHHVHRIRVFQATLGSWLEEHEEGWLRELREADVALHTAQLVDGAEASAEGLMVADEGRVRDALRAADRVTFGRREVDLHGASLLTGLGLDALREAIEHGELVARDDGRGPLLALAALAAFAEARGLPWDDGLENSGSAARHEGRLHRLLGG